MVAIYRKGGWGKGRGALRFPNAQFSAPNASFVGELAAHFTLHVFDGNPLKLTGFEPWTLFHPGQCLPTPSRHGPRQPETRRRHAQASGTRQRGAARHAAAGLLLSYARLACCPCTIPASLLLNNSPPARPQPHAGTRHCQVDLGWPIKSGFVIAAMLHNVLQQHKK